MRQFAGGSVSRQIIRPRLIFAAVMLVLGLTGVPAMAQEALRLTRNIPGDSKPIVLSADAVASWSEGGQRVVLLSGKVLIEHGLLSTRCTEAVVWVDEDALKTTRILIARVYAEGNVVLENGNETRRGPTAEIALHTRGELRMKSQSGKVVQTPQLKDPLYLRALTARGAQAAPKADKTADKAAPKGGDVQRTGFQDQQPPPPPDPVTPAAPGVGAPPPPAPPGNAASPPVGVAPLPPVGTPPAPAAPPGPPGSAARPSTGPALLPVAPGTIPLPARPGAPGPGAMIPRAAPDGPPRIVTIAPRTSKPFEWQSFTMANGEKAVVAVGGVILMVRNMQKLEVVDIEADRIVFWAHDAENLFSNMRSAQGQATRELEFYLAGNVEIRQQSKPGESQKMSADEAYYDVARNVAVAVSADLEITRRGVPDPIHLKADELLQLSPTLFEAVRAEVFSSRTPADPGLKVYMAQATLEEQGARRGTRTPEQVVSGGGGRNGDSQKFFRGTNVFLEVENPFVEGGTFPIFYLPFMQGSVERPFGPLIDASLGGNRIFGFQASLTFDSYDLFGIDPIEGTRWRTDVDYMSKRGPGLGSKFDYAGKDWCGISGCYVGQIRAWGLHDDGEDILGGSRDGEEHTDWRGRFQWRHFWWGLPNGFSVQAQLYALSDKNFLEQFYKNEFDTDRNADTFAYVKQQAGVGAWTALAEPRIRNWVTETEWLPRLDGYLLGVSWLDLFTYDAHASAGYARLRPTGIAPPAFVPTEVVPISASRLDLKQELAMPFSLGPVKIVPYGIVDLTYYSQDLTGDDTGRFYGAAGGRASMPLSRVYSGVTSELWNLNSINHKITFNANYFIAKSDVLFNQLPQFDLLDDDATDQARRDINPQQPTLNPQYGQFLSTSPLFNIQTYAIRRLVENRVETKDTIEVLQFDVQQRLQTKRGFPGNQHIVDWMKLDLSGSYFPHSERDNFGESLAFLQYDYLWNIGDRTALVSSGWIDPIDDGARVFTIGSYFNRPDRTTFFLGYRHIHPLNSDAVTGAATYIFSPKYAMTASSVYDFGTEQALSNSLVVTRMGSDLQVSIGVTYNVLQNNFGATLMIIPNLLPGSRRFGAQPVPGMVAQQ